MKAPKKTNQPNGIKVRVLNGLKEAIEEVKLIKQGKLKEVPVKDLLNELF